MRSDLLSRPRPLRPQQTTRPDKPVPGGGVAVALAPLLTHFFGGPPPVRFEFWDGTSHGPSHGDTLQVRSPDAVQRLLWSPGEVGLARAFVMGDLAFEGDIFDLLAELHGASPRASTSARGCPGRRCRRLAASGSSASRFPRHQRRRHREAGCTRAAAMHRRCNTTTT